MIEVLRGCKVKIGTERERERGLGRGVRRPPKKRERNGIGNVFRNGSGTVPEPKRERDCWSQRLFGQVMQLSVLISDINKIATHV